MSGTAEFNTFRYLLNGASSLLQSAIEHQEGSGYCRTSAVLFSALAVEAFLNHVGDEAIPSWDQPHIGWEDKIAVLTAHYKTKADFSRRPFQTVKALFRFRDAIAHGRSTRGQPIHFVSPPASESDEFPEHPKWLRQAQADRSVRRAIEDARAAIDRLAEKFGVEGCTGPIASWAAFETQRGRHPRGKRGKK